MRSIQPQPWLEIGICGPGQRLCPLTRDAKPNNREWRHGGRTDGRTDERAERGRERRVSVSHTGEARDERRVDREEVRPPSVDVARSLARLTCKCLSSRRGGIPSAARRQQ